MRRGKTGFALEMLEHRRLLSSLTYSLTTDQPTYQIGQTIRMTFLVTNSGSQALTIPLVPTEFTVKLDQFTE